jgi:hypothetical protein
MPRVACQAAVNDPLPGQLRSLNYSAAMHMTQDHRRSDRVLPLKAPAGQIAKAPCCPSQNGSPKRTRLLRHYTEG